MASPAQGTPVTFDLNLSGTVRNASAGAMAGVNVTATNVTTSAFYFTFTNASGEYQISLPAGIYNLTASITDFAPNTTYANLRLDSVNRTGLDFTMIEVLGTVTGFVTNGQAPIVGATVTLSGSAGVYNGTTTIPLGQYTIEGIHPGVYVAKAERVGYWTNFSATPITVQRGVQTSLSFSLEAQPALLYGKVTSGGAAIEGVKVVVSSSGSLIAQTVTDQNGNYSFSNVIEGSYSVEFSKDGYQTKTIPISISSFDKKELAVSVDRLPVEGKKGFIGDFDLNHSLMIVCLAIAFVLVIIALFIRSKAGKKPSLLAMEEEKKDEDKEPKAAEKKDKS
jgi:hypothetical protein